MAIKDIEMEKLKTILVTGPPKSGKLTQIKRLCKDFGYKHVHVKEQPQSSASEVQARSHLEPG